MKFMLTKDDLISLEEVVERVKIDILNRLVTIQDKLKDVEINTRKLEKGLLGVQGEMKEMKGEMKNLREDVKTVDLKTEAFHNKLDKKIDINHQDAMNAFKALHHTMDILNVQLGSRVDKLEKN